MRFRQRACGSLLSRVEFFGFMGVISYCFRANRELTLPRLQQHLARGESLPIKEPRGLWP